MITVLTDEMIKMRSLIVKMIDEAYSLESGKMMFDSADLLEQFIEVSSPILIEGQEQLVSIHENSSGGGISLKPGNIIVNWKKLSYNLPDFVITISAVTGPSWVIPFVLLNVIKMLYGVASLTLEADHATCLLALWEYNRGDTAIKESNGLLIINQFRAKNNQKPLSRAGFRKILDELESIKCVKIGHDGIILVEEIRIKYLKERSI